jgi:hypothetical protein
MALDHSFPGKTLAPGMTKIFQKSIDCSELPDDWLNANVAPVYKKGDVHRAENYLFGDRVGSHLQRGELETSHTLAGH